jgi:DNA-binding MarR family transcriptional regulator
VKATSPGEVRHLILAAQRHGSRMLADGLRAAELTPAQAEAIEVLAGHAPLTLAELGRLLVCEAGSPSRLVDTLVQRGLVAREPGRDDRRVVQLRLTPAGEEVHNAGKAGTAAVDDLITSRLPTTDLEQLAELLRRLLRDTPGGHALNIRYPPSA